MDTERVFAELVRGSDEIISGLRDWRSVHPQATFAELETVVNERLDGLRARLLHDLAMASTAAGEVDRPICPDCGTPLRPRGTRRRTITVPGDQPVTLTRRYWICPACGAGLFPPG
jgi:RNase P subunit RPR2